MGKDRPDPTFPFSHIKMPVDLDDVSNDFEKLSRLESASTLVATEEGLSPMTQCDRRSSSVTIATEDEVPVGQYSLTCRRRRMNCGINPFFDRGSKWNQRLCSDKRLRPTVQLPPCPRHRKIHGLGLPSSADCWLRPKDPEYKTQNRTKPPC